MKFLTDTHCHTISSGHAYSTVSECAHEAAKKQLEMIAITDHGVKMPGAPHIYHFWNLKVIPEYIEGVRILRGVEANIIDSNGTIDIEEEVLKRLDIVIVSFHDNCILPRSREENTKTLIKAMENKYIDIIGHSGNPQFPINAEEVAEAAKAYNKIVEINNTSLKGEIRAGSRENCANILKECSKKGVQMCTSTDAHICYDIGDFTAIYQFLEENDIDENLILSTSKEKFINALQNHKRNLEV